MDVGLGGWFVERSRGVSVSFEKRCGLDAPNETDVHAHVSVDTRALETDVHAKRHTRPCGVLGITIEADLQKS